LGINDEEFRTSNIQTWGKIGRASAYLVVIFSVLLSAGVPMFNMFIPQDRYLR